MENSYVLDDDAQSEGLRVSAQAAGFLKETAKWARFIAIVNFSVLGIMLLSFVAIGAFASEIFATMGLPGGLGLGVILVYVLLLIGITFFPILFLYRFGIQARRAVDFSSSTALEDAMSNIKSHYKFLGILMAIGVGIYAIMFILAIGLSAFA